MATVLAAGLLSVPGSAQTRVGKTESGIAYDVQGMGEPVVVLITGSNLDRRMWAEEAIWLGGRQTVVRYDLRAHGQSDTATGPFTHVGDLLSLLDELKIRKATLIGLSAGSTIAIDAALQEPGRFDRLVLIGPSITGYVPKERPAFSNDLMAALQAREFRKASELLLDTPVFAVPAGQRALVRQMVLENDRLWIVPRELMKPPPRRAIDHLEQIKLPTLVMTGENDLPASRDQAVILSQRLAGARLVDIKGGGHLLNLTSPKEFRSVVEQFLREFSQ